MGNQLTIRGPWLKQAQIQALIDAYAAPLSHKTLHQDGGADEITVQGLAGVLTAEQLSSWTGVSGKPTTFTPAAHNTIHQDGGADELVLTGLVGSHRSKDGSFTRLLTTSAGPQSVTGVGFTPSSILFFSVVDASVEASWGIDTLTNAHCLIKSFTGSLYTLDTANSIALFQASGVASVSKITSFDSDGFTLTWSKVGAPTGTATIIYRALF